MTGLDWSEAPIGKAHERDGFDCGEEELNLYLRRYARQNHASGGAKCFVAAPIDGPFGRTFTFADPDGYQITLHDRG